MKRFDSVTKSQKWFIAFLLSTAVVGCGGGGDPILGSGSAGPNTAGLNTSLLGTAAPFGFSATAGMTTAVSSSVVNADVLLDPIAFATCNTTPVDAFGGIGSCAPIGFAPAITVEQTRYWSLLFSHNRQAVWKGMLRIELNTPTEDQQARQTLAGANP